MDPPIWAPRLDQVADYVTSRTLSVTEPGSDTPAGTFTADTAPTADQVGRLIDAACSWVLAVTGPVNSALVDAATAAAAMRAAGLVELSYPVRNADVDTVATNILAQARFARDELATANIATGAGGVRVVPQPAYMFPDAQPWPDPSRRSSYVREV